MFGSMKALWDLLDEDSPKARAERERQLREQQSQGKVEIHDVLDEANEILDSDSGSGSSSDSDSTSSGSGGFSASSGGGGGKRGGKGGRGGRGKGGKGKGPSVQVEVPFGDRMAAWGRKAITIAIIVLIIVLLVAYWWFHPPINIHSVDTWIFCAIFILLPLFLFFKSKQRKYEAGGKDAEPNPGKSKVFKIASYVPLIIVVIGLVGGLLSFSFIPGNAKRYASILPIETLDFATDIQPVNYAEVPVIDHDAAEILGNREMGTIADYVSQFEVDELYTQINYKGTPVRVSPLNYADLIKWLFNRGDGIPAYAMVDMTTQDAKIIRISDVDGTTGAGIKYSESEPLARNIQRYVQLSFPFYMFDEFGFEVDDNGHPWWICPVQTRTIGLFGGTTIHRVVMCDAVTGECQDLTMDQVPQWVDRAYPADLLITQYNWHGAYQNGWINSWLGQSGVVKTTPGTNGQTGYNYIAKDDDVWVYTGVTSATSDNSIVGFVLINQRTGEAHFYSVVGATETSAMSSAEGAVQAYRYAATFPLLINVGDRPTYFLALKDGAGYVKQFAMIDIQQVQTVAVGNTVRETQQLYVSSLAKSGVDVNGGAAAGGEKKTGRISQMASAVVEGNTHVYVRLEGDNKIYDFSLPQQVLISFYKVGDTVDLTYVEGQTTCPAELAL